MNNSVNKLQEISSSFLDIDSIDECYKQSVEKAVSLIGADAGVYSVKDGEEYRMVYRSNLQISQKINNLRKEITTKDVIQINGKKLSSCLKEESSCYVSCAYIPLKNSESILLLSQKNAFFDKEKIEVLRMYANLVTLFLENLQLRQEKHEAIKDRKMHAYIETVLFNIHESAIKFLVPLNPEETYKIIVDEAVKLVDGKYGSLMLEDRGEFKQVYSTLPIKVKRRKKGFTYRVYAESKVMVIHPDESEEFSNVHPEFEQIGIKTILSIPLSYKNRSIGVLVINLDRKERFSNKELNLLLPFGSLVTLAIRKSQLTDELKQAIDMRDLFISMAAHELRTPMTAINGYTQLLIKKINAIPENNANWIKSLSVESSRLTNLINDLLEISRIQSGKLQYDFQEQLMDKILMKVVEIFKLGYPSRKIIFVNKVEDPVWIIADNERLTQAMINILENAIKFSPPEKEIKITLEGDKTNLITSFKDEGKGIGKSEIKRVFERYYRGSNNSVEGMGLGLYLVINVIKAHHGKIRVSSRLNKGTTFQIKLPRIKS